ncbi:hypothetical protein MRX96_029058 [Rhipicephalus microplus]
MDPKRFYGRAIPSDSEDSELSGSDDDPEYIAPHCESLNDSTNESSACSDEDEATPYGGTSDHHPTQAKRRLIWKKANLIRDPQTVRFSGQSELL